MKYLFIFINSLQRSLSYRAQLVVTLIKVCLQLGITLFIWTTLYQVGPQKNGYSLAQMIHYLIVANFLTLVFSTGPAFRLARQIKSGQLNTLLYRSLSLYGENLAFFLGAHALGIALELVMLGLIAKLTHVSLTTLLLLSLYLLVSLGMFFTLMLTLGTLSFWLIELWPLRAAVNACYLVLGGKYFPLTLLPKGLWAWLQYNPFSLVSDVLARLLLQPFTLATYSRAFLAVVIWWLIAFKLYQWASKRGLCRYEGVESV